MEQTHGSVLSANDAHADRLLGRRVEREAIAATLEAARSTQAGLLLVGEAGIGKSQLAAHAAAEATRLGFRVLAAAGGELEREMPYIVLADLLRRHADAVTAALPAPRARALDAVLLRVDQRERLEPRAVAIAVLDAIDRLGRDGPLAIILDDLHWVDPASAGALGFALRRIAAPGAALIGTQRPGRRSRLDLRSAWHDERMREVPVTSLDPDSLADLLSVRLGRRLSLPALHRVLALSAGNPLTALELARLDASELQELAGLDADRLPRQIGRLIGDRLSRLSPAAADAVARLALMTRPDDALLEGFGILPADLQAAVRADILRHSGPYWEFTHPLIRSAAAARLTTAERRSVHAGLADRATDPLERATHLAHATDTPDERTAAAVEAGARESLRRGAPLEGAQLAERAVALTAERGGSAAFDRLILAGVLRHQAGDNSAAQRHLSNALALAPPGRRAEALLALGRVEVEAKGTGAVSQYRAALRAARDERSRATAHLGLANSLRVAEQLTVARRHARLAVRAAEQSGDGELIAECLGISLVLTFNATGRIDEPSVQRILALTGQGPTEPPPKLDPNRDNTYLPHLFVWSGQFERARGVLGTIDSALAWPYGLHGEPWFLALMELWTGRWAEALRLLSELERLTESRSESIVATRALRSLVMAHLDHPDAPAVARDALRDAEREGSDRFGSIASTGLGIWFLGRDDPVSAARHFDAAFRTDLRLGIIVPGATLFAADLIEALTAAGRMEEAHGVADRIVPVSRRWTAARMVRAGMRRALASLAVAEGDDARALRLLATGPSGDQLADLPFLRARAELARGRILRRTRRRSEAREALEQAHGVFASLPAPAWAAQAERELARIGDRPGDRHRLTPTEAQVAELAGIGRTNKEIAAALVLSVKTVEWNLTRVYQKLGIRSRAELAAAGHATPPHDHADIGSPSD